MNPSRQLAVLAAVAGALALWWTLSAETGDATPPRASGGSGVIVYFDRAQPRVESRLIRAVGTAEAVRSVELQPDAEGEVIDRSFEPGDAVAAGQRLLQLDDENQRLALSLAEVELAEARRAAERLRALSGSGVVSRANLQTAESALAAARLRVAQAQKAIADHRLDAPFAGVVGFSDYDPGDRVDDESVIAILDDISALNIEFAVPERWAARIAVGDPVPMTAWSRPGERFEGVVTALDSRIDAVARTIAVRARLNNAAVRFRPGASFEAQLELRGETHPAVREVAVLWSRDGPYVWRIRQDDTVERVFGQVVQRTDGRVLMDGGVAAGDRIVVEGVQSLRAGAKVDPRPLSEAAGGRTDETS